MKIWKTVVLALSVALVTVFSGCTGPNYVSSGTKLVESFTKIECDIDAADVDIVPEGNTYKVEFHVSNQELTTECKDGILFVTLKRMKNTPAVSLEQSYVKIIVPENSTFSDVRIAIGAGKAAISKVQADTMTVNTGAGEVDLSELFVKERLTVDTGAGKIKAALLNDACSYKVSTGAGKISVNGTEFAGLGESQSESLSATPMVKLDTGAGSIEFQWNTAK